MKDFIETIKNIWKITELRKRILFTVAMIAIYRFGAYVVLPGVIPDALATAVAGRGANDILGLLNTFTGGALFKASIFALGIMPYITASIIVQLLGFAVPYFQRLQEKEGESGRNKINQITRYLTVLITLVQGGGYLTTIVSAGAMDPTINPYVFWITNIIILSTGTVFAMWLGERITDRGIGNGISLLIMIGIIARLPQSFFGEIQAQFASSGGLIIFVLELAAMFLIILLTVLITQGVRKIPVQFAKKMVGKGSSQIPVAGARDYIPVKVNAAGVMPIIFAQAIMFLPVTVMQWVTKSGAAANSTLMALNRWDSPIYNIIFFILVVVFTYVYTALIVNPKQYADYLKRMNAFIPGVKPGKSTEEYIDSVVTKITLPGSIFLGFISIFPAFVSAFGVNQAFALFFGGTSLLILVGVVLDTMQQVESHLLMRKYDGLVKSGKLKGRNTGGLNPIGSGM
ncbi:MAG TPA: preprotein translocase subunit SecY [Bacteroidetes bacterium]|nr:preprotein translocase subunit SecY [Bacteroidota bacterium]